MESGINLWQNMKAFWTPGRRPQRLGVDHLGKQKTEFIIHENKRRSGLDEKELRGSQRPEEDQIGPRTWILAVAGLDVRLPAFPAMSAGFSGTVVPLHQQ